MKDIEDEENIVGEKGKGDAEIEMEGSFLQGTDNELPAFCHR